MREVYLQIAVIVTGKVTEADLAETPVLIVIADLVRRKLGCAKQLVLFIVVIEIYRVQVVADTHIDLLPVPCDSAIGINHIGVTPFSARAAAAGQQSKAKQRNRQQTKKPFAGSI